MDTNLNHIEKVIDYIEAYLVGVDCYNNYAEKEQEKVFDYFAGAEVSTLKEIPKGMSSMQLARSKYVVFSFRGRCEESIEPVVEYIYKEWFPNATCQFNEENLYDFVKYGEVIDEIGESDMEFWVPIKD